MSGQLHPPAALPPKKEIPVPIGYGSEWDPETYWMTWRGEKSCPYRDSNFDISAVQPVAIRYADWAIPTLKKNLRISSTPVKIRAKNLLLTSLWVLPPQHSSLYITDIHPGLSCDKS
jgi:hypothetical protein